MQPSWRGIVFFLILGLSTLFLGSKSVRLAVANKLGEATQVSELSRALALDPFNPAIHHRLGLVRTYSPEETNPAEGLAHLRRAVELIPSKASYWADLAAGCEAMGDTGCADQAFERTLKLSPLSPRLYWYAANYYLRSDRVDVALARFQRLLQLSPEYAWPTFGICWRVLDNPQMIFERVLPEGPDPRLRLAYVNFLSARGDAETAFRVWGMTVANPVLFPFSAVQPYLERLIELARTREAMTVWQDLLRLGVVHQPASEDPDNLVFNGGFEQFPLNAGFDWRYRELPYLAPDLSQEPAYRGARCFRVDFTAARNEEYEPLVQFIPVVPNREYVLTAYVRTANITSESGPRLRVLDPACPSCLDVATDTTVGTTPWHAVSRRFSAPSQTQLVRLSVWRPRGRSFPTEITGTFWLDAVSLKSVGPMVQRNARVGAR